MPEYHKPVLVNETIALLDPRPGCVFLDATLGGGGHAAEILKRIGPEGRLLGVDRDPEALKYARKRLEEFGDRAVLIHGDFRNLAGILTDAGISALDGALFDLGVSSHQLDTERGFAFARDEELDMRMNPLEDTPSAADIVNSYSEHDLADVIWRYGEERYSRRIARAIVERRAKTPVTRTGELADIVTQAIPGKYRWQQGIYPATRAFQAIRIEVNRELEAVEQGIPAAIDALKVGARICVISFHSLEDRIVKRTFRRYAGHCECPPELPECRCGARAIVKIITSRPVVASAEEIEDNPRSRSAKLRCAEKTQG
ncbi:MAG: 16S rRNA (cytosine(1402)-N(4))-methyltransferase RsmH [Armatimonadetes bacterium]|nr:16S rRNA (cytosine(1402)-N(4))-methyltransferase RsmH [Armatimonadota bacterium]